MKRAVSPLASLETPFLKTRTPDFLLSELLIFKNETLSGGGLAAAMLKIIGNTHPDIHPFLKDSPSDWAVWYAFANRSPNHQDNCTEVYRKAFSGDISVLKNFGFDKGRVRLIDDSAARAVEEIFEKCVSSYSKSADIFALNERVVEWWSAAGLGDGRLTASYPFGETLRAKGSTCCSCSIM